MKFSIGLVCMGIVALLGCSSQATESASQTTEAVVVTAQDTAKCRDFTADRECGNQTAATSLSKLGEGAKCNGPNGPGNCYAQPGSNLPNETTFDCTCE